MLGRRKFLSWSNLYIVEATAMRITFELLNKIDLSITSCLHINYVGQWCKNDVKPNKQCASFSKIVYFEKGIKSHKKHKCAIIQ